MTFSSVSSSGGVESRVTMSWEYESGKPVRQDKDAIFVGRGGANLLETAGLVGALRHTSECATRVPKPWAR